MFRLILSSYAFYTAIKFFQIIVETNRLKMYHITGIAVMCFIVATSLGFAITFGYGISFHIIIFQSWRMSLWFIIDTLEVTVLYMMYEYFCKQINRHERRLIINKNYKE